jgi:hypothetical protein
VNTANSRGEWFSLLQNQPTTLRQTSSEWDLGVCGGESVGQLPLGILEFGAWSNDCERRMAAMWARWVRPL